MIVTPAVNTGMKKERREEDTTDRPRAGRNPVIAVRVPPALHQRITKVAQDDNRSMSEVMADLLARAFDWHDAFGDRVSMLKQAKAELEQMITVNFDVEALRRGWRPPLPAELRTGFRSGDPRRMTSRPRSRHSKPGSTSSEPARIRMNRRPTVNSVRLMR